MLDKIDSHYQKAAKSIRTLILLSLVTNTYQEVRQWIDDKKVDFPGELDTLAGMLSAERKDQRAEGGKDEWQRVPDFFKWHLI